MPETGRHSDEMYHRPAACRLPRRLALQTPRRCSDQTRASWLSAQPCCGEASWKAAQPSTGYAPSPRLPWLHPPLEPTAVPPARSSRAAPRSLPRA
eukprot:scaffold6285_cov121-Isochrysis_galbana.AAC.14